MRRAYDGMHPTSIPSGVILGFMKRHSFRSSEELLVERPFFNSYLP